ncbi:hypothetical protein EPI10_024186 [Gossypium australe]|uniref:Uncharacterized protein n=1 Tax=Gossypium australe TaxID=47621 RepID=A0A5B6VW87_9ROSI|nr:hypothetical protein EPI10_024186 [Gossypium australe]
MVAQVRKICRVKTSRQEVPKMTEKKATTPKFFLVVLIVKRPITHKKGVGGSRMSPQQQGKASAA